MDNKQLSIIHHRLNVCCRRSHFPVEASALRAIGNGSLVILLFSFAYQTNLSILKFAIVLLYKFMPTLGHGLLGDGNNIWRKVLPHAQNL